MRSWFLDIMALAVNVEPNDIWCGGKHKISFNPVLGRRRLPGWVTRRGSENVEPSIG